MTFSFTRHLLLIFLPYFFTSYFGRSGHTYFFRRKVSASRILQVPDALFPEFFQKLFLFVLANKIFKAHG